MMNRRISYSGGSLRGSASGLLTKAVAITAGALILVAGLFVSAVVFSVLLVAGLVAGGWLWWKTRHLRRDLRARVDEMRRMQAGEAQGDPLRDPFLDPFRGTAFDPLRRNRSSSEADIIDGDYIRDPDPAGR